MLTGNTLPARKRPNRSEVAGDGSAILWIRSKGRELPCFVDVDDLPTLEAYPRSWCIAQGPRVAYVRGSHGGALLHHLLVQPPDGLFVDHIDGNPLNNRRSNLRLVTRAQNAQNRVRRGRELPRGVCLDRGTGKWKVQAKLNGKTHYGGLFTDLEEAHAAAVALRARLFSHHVEERHQLPS